MQTHAQKHMAQYPARPKATPEILLEAGMKVEKNLNAYAHWEGECEGLGQALARLPDAKNLNGYELAKALEGSYLIDPDETAVDELAGFGPLVTHLVRQLQREWAEQHKVQPPHPIGTQLREGVITDIYAHGPAAYLVDFGHKTSRRIIQFEDAVTAQEWEQSATAPAATH